MKRFHVHLAVENLADSVGFYSELFGAPPTVQRDDYAKWMIDDPRVNFAISSRGHKPGINHLGFQAENEQELAELGERADRASGSQMLAEKEVACCYAKGNKYWVVDPQGLAWEHFHTLGEMQPSSRPAVSRFTKPRAQPMKRRRAPAAYRMLPLRQIRFRHRKPTAADEPCMEYGRISLS